MILIDNLMTFFGIDNLSNITTFAEFIPWFVKVLLAVFLVCFAFKCFFNSVWKIGRGLK